MLRILHVARNFGPATERRADLMARAPGVFLARLRPDGSGHDHREDELHGRSAQTADLVRIPVWNGPVDPHRMVYRSLTFALPRLEPDVIFAEEEPDSLSALQLVAARRLFAPRARLVLQTWQNVDRRKRPPVLWVLKRTLGAADAIVASTGEAASLLRHLGYGGPTPVILPAGFDPSLVVEAHCPTDRAVHEILFAGRLAPEKGVETLVDAVSTLDLPVRLTLAGDGPERGALERRVAERGLAGRTRFLGALAPAAVARQMAESDVLVLPSRTTPVWKEQFGRVLAEAMACGLPVVGSDSGAIPEVIDDAGLVFPEGDAAALRERLRELLSSPDLARTLAERGRSRAFRLYTPEVLAGQTLAFLRGFAPDAPPGQPARAPS